MTLFNAILALTGAAVGTIVVLIPAVSIIAHTAGTIGHP